MENGGIKQKPCLDMKKNQETDTRINRHSEYQDSTQRQYLLCAWMRKISVLISKFYKEAFSKILPNKTYLENSTFVRGR